ncbi:prepilin peptidase [Clostridium cellulovorans]|uniref:Prepilin peptidase n=1 Tax=Clostridium cellulovorans (strain ATCC 35296 / DSM 3052 / OCM 3 / 743B) TaxID=573061 RepID=D9SSZ4_CLOC7|nr:A24 family peptidase [Clostridium cellulovorans]ADL52656.1 Prepilin peptidase [Clostridium cellulovorans 743B]
MIVLIVLGFIIGSFLNVCVCRIPLGESIVYPASSCRSCSEKIKVFDLIPILSYLVLKGRCRTCGEKISIRYPLIELLNGCLFGLIYWRYGLNLVSIKFIIMIEFLIVIALIDYDTKYVYSKNTYSGMGIGLILDIYLQAFNKICIIDYLLGLLLGIVTIGTIVAVTKAMGAGDIEISALIGIFVGWKLMLLTIFFSLVIGSVISIILVISNRRGLKDEIAFGPYLAMGSIISCLYGTHIIDFYLKTVM